MAHGCRELCVLTLLLALGAGRGGVDRRELERLVYLVQYIGADYGLAVHEGGVANAAEYQEMLDFARVVEQGYAALRGRAANPQVQADLARLAEIIRERRPWHEVRGLGRELAAQLVEEGDLEAQPSARPDLARGRERYARDCMACHGAAGAGDGWAAEGMDPPPGSFRDAVRMGMVSPHQVAGAVEFGIEGTAMPSFEGAYTEAESWDIAFFVMTLRAGFDPRPSAEPLALSLRDLGRQSNEELLERGRAGAGITLAQLDRARAGDGPTTAAASPAPVAPGGGDPDLDVARRLESAFTRVAESVFPSVAGITLYRREVGTASGAAAGSGWREGDRADAPYPGYVKVRSSSGVFVAGDGYLLTSSHVLGDASDRDADTIVDVELEGNLRFRARIIGVEPTVQLAVLKIEAPVPVPPARLGDSERVRVGQWAIALGDPPGVDRTFAPGAIAARPQKDCYQESRTSTLLQTSIRIGAESLGGPLVDLDGEVIGIAVPPSARPFHDDGEDALRALPIHLARTLYEALKVAESTRSPWLGVAVRNLTWQLRNDVRPTPRTGLYIEDVFDPSPASRAGVRVGDFLTAIDGNRLFAVPDFQRWLYLLGIGRTVTLELFRQGEVLERQVTIEQRPPVAAPR